MNAIDNLRSYFTIDRTPDGVIDKNKQMLGAIALVGIVIMIAASILGLGLPLVVVGIPASIKLVAMITVANSFAITAWAVNKLRQDRGLAPAPTMSAPAPTMSAMSAPAPTMSAMSAPAPTMSAMSAPAPTMSAPARLYPIEPPQSYQSYQGHLTDQERDEGLCLA